MRLKTMGKTVLLSSHLLAQVQDVLGVDVIGQFAAKAGLPPVN